MLDGNGRILAALGGLVAVVGTASLALTIVFGLPEEPRAAPRKRSDAPAGDYRPGGSGCDPAQLKLLAPKDAPTERNRCAEAREQHRSGQDTIAEAVRANDVAEQDLRLSWGSAKIAFLQTLATVAAFIAAAGAALIALRAVHWARQAAEHTEAGATAAQDQLEAVRMAERAYLVLPATTRLSPKGGLLIGALNYGRTLAHADEIRFASRTSVPKSPSLAGLRLQKLQLDSDLPNSEGRPLGETTPLGPNIKLVVGYIRYVDIYRREHRSHFRYDREDGGTWTSCGGETWNRAT
jgi:hypothetical protein